MTATASSAKLTITFATASDLDRFGTDVAGFLRMIADSVRFDSPIRSGSTELAFTASGPTGPADMPDSFEMTFEPRSEPPARAALVFLDGTVVDAADGPSASPGSTADCQSKSDTRQVFPAAIIDKQLVLVGKQVTPKQQSAIEICLLYVDAAARAERKDARADAKTSFDALIQKLVGLGFVVKTSDKTTTLKIFNLTAALTEVARRHLDSAQFEAFNAANHALQTGTAPDQTLDILRDWWASGSADGAATAVVWGMITLDDGQPALMLLYLAFSQSVPPGYASAEGFVLTIVATTLTLDMSIYEKIESDLRARLGGKITQYIRHVTLQLDVAD